MRYKRCNFHNHHSTIFEEKVEYILRCTTSLALSSEYIIMATNNTLKAKYKTTSLRLSEQSDKSDWNRSINPGLVLIVLCSCTRYIFHEESVTRPRKLHSTKLRNRNSYQPCSEYVRYDQ